MADPQIISEWLKKANEDLEFAISVIEDSTFYAQICFHFHQAADYDLEFKKIHDLPVLLKLSLVKKPELKKLMNDCRLLNGFYIDTRYPVHWPTQYTKEEALKAKKAAEHIGVEIKKALKPLSPNSQS